MVDSKAVTEQQIGTTPTGLAQITTTDPMLLETIKNFQVIQQNILDDIKDPQITPNAYDATIEEMLRQLRTAINERNSGKIQDIKEMKNYLATLE